MSTEFVHLHVHTDYSMLDGACQVKRLAELCKTLAMKSIAITDHGNMHGAIEFVQECGKAGVKPILGCEFYQAPGRCTDRDPNHPHRSGYHLLVFAETFAGYQNLCRLNAKAHLDGYYFKPRIDKELLAKHAQGLIGTTACVGGEVPQYILEGNLKQARTALGEYVDIFGKGNFYLELQDHGMAEQHTANKALLDLAKEFELPILATNDVHYLKREHALPHEVLLCIGTQKTMLDKDHMQFPAPEFYLKSPDEMAKLFPDHPEALSNSLAIAERCNVVLPIGKESHYPVYNPPDAQDRVEFFARLCGLALQERYGIDYYGTPPEQFTPEQRSVIDRMHYEIQMIAKMGFVSYYLVVWDFLHYARTQGIPVGPGRGSGAGSIAAYLLHITDIEPLRYGLLFERFLNPERVSPPDFDIDLCERRRGEVIEYVRRKYGSENVAQISTFSTLKPKAVVKDVARAVGRGFEDGNRLTKLIPDTAKKLKDALEESAELRQFREQETWTEEIFKFAEPLEGLNRNGGIHAAGVIIGDQPLTNLVPLCRGAGDEVVTQYPAGPCEGLGLLKMDFLGLRTLTIIQDACNLIAKSRSLTIDPSTIPLDDQTTYDLLNRGRTVCVFQLESGGMQDLCRRFGVDRIEDIIALIALYRPGPMQFIDEFIACKQGRAKAEYDVPVMKEILEETQGIMLYQEQVMQVVQRVAGFSLGQADILRRAMGKKKADVMQAQFERFREGCVKNGVNEATAEAIWKKIEKFAGYGFNKSHSAAYAFLAYRTAYLKANYPVEFMAANLTSDMHKSDRVSELIEHCRAMDIRVLPPDVNSSDMAFSVDGAVIRFGLGAIKGVGEGAAQAIIAARCDGPFTSLQEFCERVGSSLNRRIMECLTQCGAFDCFGWRRAQVYAVLDEALARAQSAVRDRQKGQATFFDMLGGNGSGGTDLELQAPNIPEWVERDRLRYEKELLGFYVTGHPLDEYASLLKLYSLSSVRDLLDGDPDSGVRVGGTISHLARKISKKDGRPWAIITLEDREGNIECLVYSEAFAEYGPLLAEEAPVFVEGYLQRRETDERSTVVVNKVVPIEDVERSYSSEMIVRLDEGVIGPDQLRLLLEVFKRHPGETRLALALACRNGKTAFIEAGKTLGVAVDDSLKVEVRRLLGDNSFRLKPNRKPPEGRRRRWENRGEAREAIAS